MYTIIATTRFKSDLKRISHQIKSIDKLETVVNLIVAREALPQKNRDHPLIGNYAGFRECHIEPDWLLICRADETRKTAILCERAVTQSYFVKQ